MLAQLFQREYPRRAYFIIKFLARLVCQWRADPGTEPTTPQHMVAEHLRSKMDWHNEWLHNKLSPLNPQFVPPPPPPGLSNETSRGNIIDRTESSLNLLGLVDDVFPAPAYALVSDSDSSSESAEGTDSTSLRTNSADSVVYPESSGSGVG